MLEEADLWGVTDIQRHRGATMRGHVLRYTIDGTGIISGDDGQRYNFTATDWKLTEFPTQGMYVDFDVQEDRAVDFVLVPTAPAVSAGQKSKVAAGLLALLLGTLGVHKFYLGYPGTGIIYIVLSFTFIGLIFTVPASLIEGIIYLVKSDEDFDRIYVQGRRAWF